MDKDNDLTPEITAEATRLLHLAMIRQVELWTAIEALESLLESQYVAGSPEHRALRLRITDAIAEMASDPDKTIPELLAGATVDGLREMLIELDSPEVRPV